MRVGSIYVRKSIHTFKGESIKNQIEMCKAFAKDNDILIDDDLIYCDEGYSGKNLKRPQFKQMLNDLNDKKFNIIMCYRLDRISRSLKDFSNLIQKLDNSNCSFISIKEQFDTSTPLGKSMMYIASVFSELERETIAERIKDNLYSLARSGRWLGGITPTGFKSTLASLNSGSTIKQTYILEPISEEIKIINHLFDKFLSLKNLSRLEDYCKQYNIKSKNNLYFTQSTLKQILVNPVYCVADEDFYDYLNNKKFSICNDKTEFNGKYGVLSYEINKEKLVSISAHKGVIVSKQWIEVQEVIYANSKVPSRQGTSSIGFCSGIIYCEFCKRLMRVKYGRKTNNHISYYYLCTTKEKDKNKCESHNLNGADIDNIIFENIIHLLVFKSFSCYFLEYLCLYKDLNKSGTISQGLNPTVNYLEELELLNIRLEALKFQSKTQVNSSSNKYIIEQIKTIKYRISVLNNHLINDCVNHNLEKTSELLNDIIKFYENIIYTFNLFDLNFVEKKYFLNEIISFIKWNNLILSITFK